MLQELAIKNFAIIQEIKLSFEGGMTVLTGETGAGKSIIIDAVGLLAGGRGSTEFIRHGEAKCSLEGLFVLPVGSAVFDILEQYDIEAEDNTILLQRDIHHSGKNVCRINGRMVTTAVLRHVGENMIDIHGQNEHQELMNPERHLAMLDQFGGQELTSLKDNYHNIYVQYKQARKDYEKWHSNEQELVQRMDMLAFQVQDIETADLQTDEEQVLEEEKRLLLNYQKIMGALSASYEALQGDEGGGIDLVGGAMNELGHIEDIDKRYHQFYEAVSEGYFILQEAASDILAEMEQMSWDENRLNEIETRLELIHQLKRKYGNSIEQILAYYEQISNEYQHLQDREGHTDELEQAVSKYAEKLKALGKELSKKRQQVAKVLSEKIHEQLKELYMEKVVFEVNFAQVETNNEMDRYLENGCDVVEFFISTNPGEPLKPLVKIASGGELSRMMLAMKTIFSASHGITSIIFDEVDTGVSGRVSQAIAEKIYQVASYSQVLCITHLPQVAAMADHHLFIDKHVKNGRTETSMTILTGESRINEIARMLAGSEITSLTLEHAKELLKMATAEQQKIHSRK